MFNLKAPSRMKTYKVQYDHLLQRQQTPIDRGARTVSITFMSRCNMMSLELDEQRHPSLPSRMPFVEKKAPQMRPASSCPNR